MTAARVKQGWEGSPPLCRNCDHFLNGGAYKQLVRGKHIKQAHRCSLGGFNTAPHAICDEWTQKGERLESPASRKDLPAEGTRDSQKSLDRSSVPR